MLTDTAKEIIAERYAHDSEGPAEVFARVAEYMARANSGKDRDAYFEMMSRLDFLPNTPALANAGQESAQMSACFVLPIDDELGATEDGIFQVMRKAALIQHTGGGNGFDFSRLRPRGSPIGRTMAKSPRKTGVSTGPVSFMRAFQAAFKCIAQGGIRRGANMAVLRVDHPDIEQFIECKAVEGDLDCFNISVGLTDEFMLAVESDGPFDLRFVDIDSAISAKFAGSIDDAASLGITIKVHKTVRAREIFGKMTACSRRNGEPGVLFLDTANRANQLSAWYRLESTNPCVIGDTMVACGGDSGKYWRHARDFEPGDSVSVFDHRLGRTLVYSKEVETVEKNRDMPVYTAVFANGAEITVTRSHQFYVKHISINSAFAALSLEGNSAPKITPIALCDLTVTDDVCVAPVDNETREYAARCIANSFVRARVIDGAIRAKFTYNEAEELRLMLLGFFIHAQIVRCGDAAEIVVRDIATFEREVELAIDHPLTAEIDDFLESCMEPYVESWTTRLVSIRPAGIADVVYDLFEPTTDTWNTAGIVSRGCGEQWLGPYESCCLGSINLANFVTPNASLDLQRLAGVARLAARFLDDLVTMNAGVPSVPRIREVALDFRRIGVGIMGLGDVLMMLGLPYDSAEGRELAANTVEFIRYHVTRESIDLAARIGPFRLFDATRYIAPKFESKFRPDLDWQTLAADYAKYGIRNASLLTSAPTGTISNVAGCQCSGCEPAFALVYRRKMRARDDTFTMFDIINPYIAKKYPNIGTAEYINGSCQSIAAISPADRAVFKTAGEIAWRDHIAMQAILQEIIDSSISKTINMPPETTPQDVADAVALAWKSGCKGLTIYVAGSRQQEVLTVAAPKTPVTRRPTTISGRTTSVETPLGRAYVTINDIGGSPYEVFINASKAGSATSAVCEALGRIVSLTLRVDAAKSPAERLKLIAEQLEGIGGGNPVGRGPSRVMSLPDGIAKAIMERPELAEIAPSVHRKFGDICPYCGAAAWISSEGCAKCIECGCSRCS